MDDSLRIEIERMPEAIRAWLFMIAAAETNGNPRLVNRSGGGRGAHGAFQMREDALTDSGYTIEQITDSVRMQVAAAARYLSKIGFPEIRRNGLPINVDTVAQAWHDGPYSLRQFPSREVTRSGGWIDRALGAARYIATPVVTSLQSSVGSEWLRVFAWSVGALTVTVSAYALWRYYR